MNSQEVKVRLRQKLKNLRESLNPAERALAESQSEAKILDFSEWKKAAACTGDEADASRRD